MHLRDWLSQEGIGFAEFARRINVSNATVVRRYAYGERTPERTVMPRIVEATNGAVQPNDFFELSDNAA